MMATNAINARLVVRFGSDRMLLLGAIGAAASGVLVVLAAGTGWGGLSSLVVTLFLFNAMNGFIIANAIAGALNFPQRAGSVSALVGAIQYGSGMIGSALTGAFANGTPRPMAGVIAIGGLGSLLCVVLAVRPRRTPA